MDFVGGGGGGGGGGSIGGTTSAGLGSDNGPILYSEPNRTSAIDDIRSVVIYIFIVTIFLSFFLILPGIRYEKFPTFLCITTSLIVTSIIIVALFGTTWHVSEAPISAAYKAHSRDRIQGDLSVKIGLQSVNITLRAHKYYILHASNGPIIMDNTPISSSSSSSSSSNSFQQAASHHHSTPTEASVERTTTIAEKARTTVEQARTVASVTSNNNSNRQQQRTQQNSLVPAAANENSLPNESGANVPEAATTGNFADELLGERNSDGQPLDTELEVEEVFGPNAASASAAKNALDPQRRTRSSSSSAFKVHDEEESEELEVAQQTDNKSSSQIATSGQIKRRSTNEAKAATTTGNNNPTKQRNAANSANNSKNNNNNQDSSTSNNNAHKYTIKRVNVDINYNERFYWIGPNQMSQEHHNALERGLPYPILTVVEYLSQDAAGFSWSRQYRLAGYYSYIMLWLSLCCCVLMFFLHCAAPKYGIYTMQILGLLLLFTNFTYAILVPKGEQKLVITIEGKMLTFKFGWNFWIVFIGGCLSLVVGTLIVIIDSLFPNFIFTTILDVDFDSHNTYYQHRIRREKLAAGNQQTINAPERPIKPPFYDDSTATTTKTSSTSSAVAITHNHHRHKPARSDDHLPHSDTRSPTREQHHKQSNSSEESFSVGVRFNKSRHRGEKVSPAKHLSELFVDPSTRRATLAQSSDSEPATTNQQQQQHHQRSSASSKTTISDRHLHHKQHGGQQSNSTVRSRHQQNHNHNHQSQQQQATKSANNLGSGLNYASSTSSIATTAAATASDYHQVRL